MKVVRFNNDFSTTRNEYDTDLTDIREIAQKFGRTDDTLRLYSDDGELVAIATWPAGSKVYKYCYGGNLDPNRHYCVFRY